MTIYVYDGSRLIKGDDWNVMQKVVEDIAEGHVHDGEDSRLVPEKVDELPDASGNVGRVVVLSADGRLYLCIPV